MRRKSKPGELPTEEAASICNSRGELLYEIVFNGEESSFISLVHGKPHFSKIYEANGVRYVPAEHEALKKGAVILPRTATPYASVDELLQNIQSFIHRYLDVSSDYEVFAAHYILLTWVYDRLNTIPYLRALGDFSTGKSRFLNVIGGICYTPIRMAGTVTAAPIYRLQGFWRGTLIIDEGDRKRSDESDEITKILNCGFEKNNPVLRCNVDDPNDVEAHDVFGPKVIGSRQTFYDQALESRCLTESMRETTRTDIPTILPPDFYREQEALRAQLLYFRLSEHGNIDPSVILKVDFGGDIERRLRQAFSGFSVLLANKPELLEKFKRFVLDYQRSLVEQRESTLDGAIISYLFEQRERVETPEQEIASQISSSDILAALQEKSGFSEMTAAKIGRRLRSLGIPTKNMKIEGRVKRGIVWQRSDMNRLFLKYVSDASTPPATTATTATVATDGSTGSEGSRRSGGSLNESDQLDVEVVHHV